jgi:hypothetical protein
VLAGTAPLRLAVADEQHDRGHPGTISAPRPRRRGRSPST